MKSGIVKALNERMVRDYLFAQLDFRIGLYCSTIFEWYNNLVKKALFQTKQASLSL